MKIIQLIPWACGADFPLDIPSRHVPASSPAEQIVALALVEQEDGERVIGYVVQNYASRALVVCTTHYAGIH